MAEPIFALPFAPAGELAAALAGDLAAQTDFDATRNLVGPAETSAAAAIAVTVRAEVLLQVYRGDYHTDSFETARLAEQVRRGDEQIWFWGDATAIAALRRKLAGEFGVATPPLGTVTVLAAESEYGPGHAELCRSGSTSSFSAKGPILQRTLRYVTGAEQTLSGRFHSLVLVPRNRASTPTVRGGEAIHRIHRRYVRSRFWGFAPWYVMQEDALELLDFRESNRDPDEVRAAVAASPPWWFAAAETADFAIALAHTSLGVAPAIELADDRGGVPPGAAELHLPPPSIARWNHAWLAPSPDGTAPFVAQMERAEAADTCCVVARLRLDDPAQLAHQSWLEARGFRLTSVTPPKRMLPPLGYWSRPRLSAFALAPPYYAGATPGSPDEAVILRYLARALTWT